MPQSEWIQPGSYQAEAHFYPRVLNAQLHPLVKHFLGLGNERIAQRYCHLHPEADAQAVRELLATPTRILRWAGADLIHATTPKGVRRNVVIEVNSSPSGQKSMPLQVEEDERGGYAKLLERSFLPMLKRRGIPKGALAVLWDKNEMETRGYAAILADLTQEPVLLAHLPASEGPECVQVDDGVLSVQDPDGAWTPLRGAFRYVTQRPWTRLPPITRTALLNPVLGCLAGGRNKALAAQAYHRANLRRSNQGLVIRVPETFRNVHLHSVPGLIADLGGVGVVKDPYSNAGQGVWTVTSPQELEAFMAFPHRYQRFIVQALVGNSEWSSTGREGRFYHLGTVPNRKGEIFAADLRFMIGASPEGFFPVSLYARRARAPLAPTLDQGTDSWDMLGTNLSVKQADGSFTTEPERLMLMDRRDFNALGLGLDDLTEGYIQTILAVTAIDELARELLTQKGVFRNRHFASMNPDPALNAEIRL
ncbi:MAG: hypothetical protein VX899_19835 [Myxococcota bacterium]|nr:hypothetical protein [Myxococcota bacterium]